jgi:carboxyl-terminal processing protease
MLLGHPLLAGASTTNAPEGLSCKLIPDLLHYFLSYHLTFSEISPTLQERTAERFLAALDPLHVLLIQPEVKDQTAKLVGVFSSARGGDCRALEELRRLVVSRKRANTEIARRRLTHYQLAATGVAASAREYAATEKGRLARAAAEIDREMNSYAAAGIPISKAAAFLLERYRLDVKAVEREPLADTFAHFANAFANALDSRSRYFTQQELEASRRDIFNYDAGVRLRSEGGLLAVSERSAATQLQVGDRLIKLFRQGAETYLWGRPVDKVYSLLRGKLGESLLVSVWRKGRVEDVSVRLLPPAFDKPRLSYVDTPSGNETRRIAVLEVPTFISEADGLLNLIREAAKQTPDALVLDLSQCEGGLLDAVIKISQSFVGQGQVAATRDKRGKMKLLGSVDFWPEYGGPLVVLTSSSTAAGGEIIAGALRDYRRAVLVGDASTYGTATVRSMIDVPNTLGLMMVTVAHLYLPSGNSFQGSGVPPDLVLTGVPQPAASDRDGPYALPRPPAMERFASLKKPQRLWVPNRSQTIPRLRAVLEAWNAGHPGATRVEQAVTVAAAFAGEL